jgi:hypothetical protein
VASMCFCRNRNGIYHLIALRICSGVTMSKRIYNPNPTIDDICIVCGAPYAELHEVFYGHNRRNSQLYGLQVRLCHHHHQVDDYYSPHRNPRGKFNLLLKEEYKQQFIDEHSEDDWLRIFKGTIYKKGM